MIAAHSAGENDLFIIEPHYFRYWQHLMYNAIVNLIVANGDQQFPFHSWHSFQAKIAEHTRNKAFNQETRKIISETKQRWDSTFHYASIKGRLHRCCPKNREKLRKELMDIQADLDSVNKAIIKHREQMGESIEERDMLAGRLSSYLFNGRLRRYSEDEDPDEDRDNENIDEERPRLQGVVRKSHRVAARAKQEEVQVELPSDSIDKSTPSHVRDDREESDSEDLLPLSTIVSQMQGVKRRSTVIKSKCKRTIQLSVCERAAPPAPTKRQRRYEVLSISGMRVINGQRFYEVNWKDYKEKTWEPWANLKSAQATIDAFISSIDASK